MRQIVAKTWRLLVKLTNLRVVDRRTRSKVAYIMDLNTLELRQTPLEISVGRDDDDRLVYLAYTRAGLNLKPSNYIDKITNV